MVDDLINGFLSTYKEFQPLHDSVGGDLIIKRYFDKVRAIYAEYKDVALDGALKYPFFMLVAHNIVMDGHMDTYGISATGGILASSSVDSVSASYQQAPFTTTHSYYLAQTRYGQEYLAYIARQSGIKYFK